MRESPEPADRPAPAPPPTPAPAPAMERWVALSLVVLGLPFAVALAESLSHPTIWRFSTGDDAPFEARLLTLFEAPPLVGPYSRHLWHHPGPLAFWLFGLPYRALGREPLALPVVALALGAASLASIVRSVLRLAEAPYARALGLSCVALLVANVSSALEPTGLALSWNPVCTLLPFAALILASAELATGAWPRLVPIALLHTFVIQEHIAYLVPATSALGLALVLAWRSERARAPEARRTAEARRAVLLACVLLVLLWSPVVYDELFGAGNLREIVGFFWRGEVPGQAPAAAASLLAWRLTEGLRGLLDAQAANLDASTPVSSAGPASLVAATLVSVLLVVLLAVAALRPSAPARGRGARELAALCLVALLAGAPSLLRVDMVVQPYLTWWLDVLGVLGVLALGGAFLPVAPRVPSARVAGGLGLALVTLLSLRTSAWIAHGAAQSDLRADRERASIEPLLETLAAAYVCRPDTRLDVTEHLLWGVLGSSVVQLGREGTRARVDEHWGFMFGPAYLGSPDAPELLVARGDQAPCPVVAGGGGLRLLDCASLEGTPPAPPRVRPVPLTPREGRGTVGELAWLVDGVAAPDGAPWDAPGVVVLSDETASITLDLPASHLSRLVVTSDDNDVLRVEASEDGEGFAPFVEVHPGYQYGQRTREVALPSGRIVRALRISPASGDGAYSLGELRLEGTLDAIREVPGPAGALTAALPARPIDGVAVSGAHDRRLAIEASMDGATFVPVGEIPAGDAGALRRFYLPPDLLASHLRVTSVGDPTGRPEVDLAPLASAGTVVDVGLRTSRPALREGFSEHPGDEAWAWVVGPHAEVAFARPDDLSDARALELRLSLEPYTGLARLGSLTVRVGAHAATVPLARGLSTVRIPLPATVLASPGDELVVELEPSESVSPASLGLSADERALSVAVHRIELRASTDWCAAHGAR